jgi:hypothetical protein
MREESRLWIRERGEENKISLKKNMGKPMKIWGKIQVGR